MRALPIAAFALVLGPALALAKKPIPPPPPAPQVNPVFAKSKVADWNVVPGATAEPTFVPPVATRLVLKNGIQLLVIENHALPIVSLQLVVLGAGSTQDPNGKGGLAELTADMLDEGAGGLSALAIARESDRLGASLSVGAGPDQATLSMDTLTKTLDASIELATKVVTQPAFEATELARVQGDAVTALELRRDRPREVAQLVLDAALYGAGTAYGHPVGGTKAEVSSLALADLKAFYADHWVPKAMTIVVAGDVQAAALKTKLDATLGAWSPAGGKAAVTPVVVPAKLVNRLLLVDRKGAAQSDVRIGLLTSSRKDPRFFQFEVLGNALGGSFTSRLNHRLREELGITYGIRAGMRYHLMGGEFQVSSAIVSAETAHGLTEILKILDGVATTDLPAEELAKAKDNLIRQLPAQFETNASTAASFAELAAFGLPDDWYATYASGVRAVSAPAVRMLAKSVIPTGKFAIAIVGDLAVVRPELDKLKLGSIALHDLYGVPIYKPRGAATPHPAQK